MGLYSYLGALAAVLTTLAYFSQVVKTHMTKHTKDISLMMYLMISSGTALWLIYGLMLREVPIVIANGAVLVLNLYVLFLKVKYG